MALHRRRKPVKLSASRKAEIAWGTRRSYSPPLHVHVAMRNARAARRPFFGVGGSH